jgi:hypothetical protein
MRHAATRRESRSDAARLSTMLRNLVFVSILFAPTLVHAGDSSWLWCHGIAERGKPAAKTHFAASVVEHRNAKGDGRELDVTLVKGGHVSRGVVANADVDRAGALTTKNVAPPANVVFTGTAKLDQSMTTFTLAGKIDENFGDPKGAQVVFNVKLTCETFDDLGIGN